MSDEDEKDREAVRWYNAGKRNVTAELLRALVPDLMKPYDKVAELQAERLRAVQALRELCGKFGDNDWPDGLALEDIIKEHLGRHLRQG